MKREAPALVPQEEIQRQRDIMAEVQAMETRPKSYFVITYGCQMNVHDSEQLAGMLREMGLTDAKDRDSADLVIFNTCCIRDNAERKALGNVMWLKQLKNKKPGLLIGVCGCMIQQPGMTEKILKQYRFIDLAFGTHNLHRLPEYLQRTLMTRKLVVDVLPDAQARIAEELPVQRANAFQAYVNIMYGCNNFCSYCIVPYVRGRERSRGMDDILREAEALLKDGVQEIMLLGQNVNSYGSDLHGEASFAQLLTRLDNLGVSRIRFMTSHPKDLSDALIEAMAGSKHICRHLHLPVQAGSNAVLGAMNRGYTREEYLRRVEKVRAAMPDIGITTDFIVGFPGETDADFEETLSLAREVGFDAAFTFVFSRRKGTRAYDLPDQVPEHVSRERIMRLIDVQDAAMNAVHESLVGKLEQVLVETVSKRSGAQVAGKCGRSITCNFAGNESLIGQIVPVRVISAGHNTLRAERIIDNEEEPHESCF